MLDRPKGVGRFSFLEVQEDRPPSAFLSNDKSDCERAELKGFLAHEQLSSMGVRGNFLGERFRRPCEDQ
jgi:hypothetical protein